MTKIYEDVKAALIDGLNWLIAGKDKIYAADLHDELFNSDNHYIHYAVAKAAAEELDVWECIGVVHTYEKNQFGEVYTPLHNACRVANMVVYIIGCELLHTIYADTVYSNGKWNEQLNTDDLKELLTIAETWLEENPDGLNKIWLDLPIE